MPLYAIPNNSQPRLSHRARTPPGQTNVSVGRVCAGVSGVFRCYCVAHMDLRVQVTDGKEAQGSADASADDTIVETMS